MNSRGETRLRQKNDSSGAQNLTRNTPIRGSGALGNAGAAEGVCALKGADWPASFLSVVGEKALCMSAVLSGALAAALLFSAANAAASESFGGYDCLADCSGPAAGYDWAEANSIKLRTDCPAGYSMSFQQGCQLYVDNPYRGSNYDDAGGSIVKNDPPSLYPALHPLWRRPDEH
jgi:hypothetical protein